MQGAGGSDRSAADALERLHDTWTAARSRLTESFDRSALYDERRARARGWLEFLARFGTGALSAEALTPGMTRELIVA